MEVDKFRRTRNWLFRWYRGEIVERDNAAMKRGRDGEPIARADYEAKYGLIMQPACVEWPEWEILRASLDGMTLDRECILEIKCPGREDHETALRNAVPSHYYPQVQQQLLVSGARVCHYWSFDLYQGTGALVEVYPDSAYIARLVQTWRDFWAQHVERDEAPPLTEADTLVRDDSRWLTLADEYIKAEAIIAEWEGKKDAAREAIVAEMGEHAKVAGGGIAATRFWKRGSVDYTKIKELAGVNLEPYRKASRQEVRLTVAKEG